MLPVLRWARGLLDATGVLGARSSADVSLHAGLEPSRRRPAAPGGQRSFKSSSSLKTATLDGLSRKKKLSQCVWSLSASAPIKNKAHF